MAVLAPGDTIIHIRLTGTSGKGVLVDANNVEIPIEDPPAPLADGTLPPVPAGHAWRLSREEYERVYNNNGFKLVGTLYHGHSSPGCLYWIGNTPVILPCP